MNADLYSTTNEKVGTITVPDGIFGARWNADLVRQAINAQRGNSRQTVAHAKGRGEVRGGGRKPWKQKGTGRARHGSRRSPIWVGGGVSHGPVKDRDFTKKINKKMKRVALFTALSKKFRDGDIVFVQGVSVELPKTKQVAVLVKPFVSKEKKANISALLVPSTAEKNIYRAAANIKGVKALSPLSLNILDVVKYGRIMIDEKAVDTIVATYTI